MATLRLHDFDALAVQVEYGRLFQIDDFARAWPLSQIAVGTQLAVQSEQRIKGVADALAATRDTMTWVDAAQARPDLEFFYQQLLERQPGLVGGKLPDAAFYG